MIHRTVADAALAASDAYLAATRTALAGEKARADAGSVEDLRTPVLGREFVVVDIGPTSRQKADGGADLHFVTLLVGVVVAYAPTRYVDAQRRAYTLLAMIDRHVQEQDPRLGDDQPVQRATITDTDPVTVDLADGKGRAAGVVATIECAVQVRPDL